ncbi:hypothetical protein G6F22_017924 [Rhizopus arrhizus]|nr:hypothetical protein G6F22_017924 [Rhizopus arrhizus]
MKTGVLAGLLPDHSRSRLQGWIEAGNVHVNGAPGKVRQTVGPGDELQVWAQPAPDARAFTPEPVEFLVVDESPEWIVVNKPAGLVTHPGAGNWSGTLLNGLFYRYPELASPATSAPRRIWCANCRRAAWDANTWRWRMAGSRTAAVSNAPSAAIPACRSA